MVISNDHKLLVANNQQQKIYDGAMKQLDSKRQGIPIRRKELMTLKGRLQSAKNVNAKIFPEINRLVNNSIANLSDNYDIHNKHLQLNARKQATNE
ncbi:hypothetical protein D3C73_1255440 [compost metagenome]